MFAEEEEEEEEEEVAAGEVIRDVNVMLCQPNPPPSQGHTGSSTLPASDTICLSGRPALIQLSRPLTTAQPEGSDRTAPPEQQPHTYPINPSVSALLSPHLHSPPLPGHRLQRQESKFFRLPRNLSPPSEGI
ncbi:unnamed protein product [Pleuronectes platessa]|uniref:Uncharacterized protein n=1 Tax=Pleuronectes platessa TaxID=8262 RepID=A0A9N7UQW6_PLEPL|nr:unnamed protein product [Pleuronectes platessa]